MRRRELILATALGVMVGTGVFTVRYAAGLSYLSSDPEVCINCHIMNPQYDSWIQSSHHHVADCVDCHLPHGFLAKYVAKAENGWHHSKAFTLQNFHEPIMIKGKNRRILEANCVSCHADTVHDMFASHVEQAGRVNCVHCHADVGHGTLPTGIGGADRALWQGIGRAGNE